MGYQIKSELKDVGYQVRNQIGDHVILADEPVKAGGTDAAPNPVQYLLTALNSCLSITAKSMARKHPQIGLKKFEITTTGTVKRFADKTSKVAEIKVHFEVETDLPLADQQHFVQSVIKYCTVHSSLDPAIEINFEY
ncbi:OsmC family protein [Liquorilactobacillus ghanensis DSM 18630]|uniref:OsmC family protein n=1 Tax=Liquorilactobacillus ghanensis DSM 18630 TaxID=1423750 RepID=A0A0R1VHJ3_9LACO|nr:OsmC family protein [Liquorilactobacillus ghanensis]KRM05232.1 OsmC family protein [Liquorilactobacillus ghanensis DSM 18630]